MPRLKLGFKEGTLRLDRLPSRFPFLLLPTSICSSILLSSGSHGEEGGRYEALAR
jgi:hypothetical protein